MTQRPITLTVVDPREFDGDPYQVATRAMQQAQGLALVLRSNLEAADLMARNAELERAIATGLPLDEVAKNWPESPQGRKLAAIQERLEAVAKDLQILERAASYDPKSREARR